MEEGRLGQEENAGAGRKGPGQMTSAGSRPGRPAAGLSIHGGRSRGPENSPRREWLRHSSTMVTRGHGGLGTQGAKVSCEGDPGVRPGRPQTVKNGAPCVSDILAKSSRTCSELGNQSLPEDKWKFHVGPQIRDSNSTHQDSKNKTGS